MVVRINKPMKLRIHLIKLGIGANFHRSINYLVKKKRLQLNRS